MRNSYCPKQYCAGFKCIKESEIKSKKTTNVRWCNLLVCLHSTSWYTIVWQKGIQDEFQMGPFVLLQTYGKLYDSIKKWMMWHHEPCAALFVWKKPRTNRTLNGVNNIFREHCSFYNTGIPRFTLLMWGHIKNPRKAKTA